MLCQISNHIFYQYKLIPLYTYQSLYIQYNHTAILSQQVPRIMNSPIKIKNKRIKAFATQPHSTQQQKAKQKLIEFSEIEDLGKDPYEKLTRFLENRPFEIRHQSNQYKFKVLKQKQHMPIKIVSPLPKFNLSEEFKKQCQYLQNVSETNIATFRGLGKSKQHKSGDKLIRQPISLCNYLVTGQHESSTQKQRQHLSAPKSDYIVRQRRNQKKLKRSQQKRQFQQIRTKNSIFDKLIAQRQAQKLLHMKSIMLGSKYKNWVLHRKEKEKDKEKGEPDSSAICIERI